MTLNSPRSADRYREYAYDTSPAIVPDALDVPCELAPTRATAGRARYREAGRAMTDNTGAGECDLHFLVDEAGDPELIGAKGKILAGSRATQDIVSW